MQDHVSRTVRRTAFTLIELLVVVAIIAVIAAILFPVFSAVREKGRRTACQSNLKQIALAMQQYVQDNGGTYPPGARCDGQDCFVQWPRAIFPYVKNVQVFRCPDQPTGKADPVDVDHLLTSSIPTPGLDYWYDMIRLTTNVLPPPSASFQHGNHESSLSTPSTILLNMESSWRDSDGVDHYFRNVTSSCGLGFSGNTLHSGGSNYSYADGHVKWLTPEQAADVECLNGPEARDYVFFQ